MATPVQRWMGEVERAYTDRSRPAMAFALEKLVQAAKIEECNMNGEQRYEAYRRQAFDMGLQRPTWAQLPEQERQIWERIADGKPAQGITPRDTRS
jgi:FixJ family two-component response regulator